MLGKCSATELAVQPPSFLISFLPYPIKVGGVFILKYSKCADKITYVELPETVVSGVNHLNCH